MSLDQSGIVNIMLEVFPDHPVTEIKYLTAGNAPWDSLGHLRLMMALELATGQTVPADKFGELTSISAIEAHFSQ